MRDIYACYITRDARVDFEFKISNDDQTMRCGDFLFKYGRTILTESKQTNELKKWDADKTSFPMKLSAEKEDGTYFVFDNNKKYDWMPSITGFGKVLLLLELIPNGEEIKFRGNVQVRDQPPPKAEKFTKFYNITKHRTEVSTKNMESEYVNTVNIALDVPGFCHNAMFYFPREEVEKISYGMFLFKYGKDILDIFRGNVADDLIPPFEINESFPMELRYFDLGSYRLRFNNDNRDQTLHWHRRDQNILLLTNIPSGSEDSYSKAVDVTYGAENLPNCGYCINPLHSPVHAFDVSPTGNEEDIRDSRLPNIEEYDAIRFPCGHSSHTHCVLKAFRHRHYGCVRCTKKPPREWWVEFFAKAEKKIHQCHIDHVQEERMLQNRLRFKKDRFYSIERKITDTMKFTKHIPDESGEGHTSVEDGTMLNFLSDKSQLELSITQLQGEITEHEKEILIKNLILDFMGDELDLVQEENNSSSLPASYSIRSVFNQENITDITGFQRLNLLLARHI